MTAAPEPADWLRAQLRITTVADREVLRAVQDARVEILRMLRGIASRPGVGAAIRREQLLLAKREMLRVEADLWRRLGNIIQARRLQAASNVIGLGEKLDAIILRGGKGGPALARAIADAERDAIARALDRTIARVSGASYVPLSQRVYNSEVNLSGQINRIVNSSITSGLSAVEFANRIRNFINPNTPGGIRYAAMRLSRTEINNAAHAVAIDAQRDKPWVEGMQWHLSSSHPKPDVCDDLARGGVGGRGQYAVADTPSKPHPHCFCFVTPAMVDGAAFLDNLVAGRYDTYLSRYANIQAGQPVFTKLG